MKIKLTDHQIRELKSLLPLLRKLSRPPRKTEFPRIQLNLDRCRSAQARVITAIVRETCKHYGYSQRDLLAKGRPTQLCWARQVTMYLIREYTQAPFMLIGEVLGHRHHGTVMHACQTVRDLTSAYPNKYGADIQAVQKHLAQAGCVPQNN